MLLSSIVLIFFSLGHFSSAVQVNIHKTVTEVRKTIKGVGSFQYPFQDTEYNNVVDGSISWDGTPFVKQELYNTIATLKGALVTVQRSTVCECTTIQAKIIDPNSMLLENIDTGTYFYADSRSVEYTSQKPTASGTSLVFDFKTDETKFSGTLSYLMRGITWLPNYELSMADDNKCSLYAYAVIRNTQQQEYDIDGTNLYSGDLPLVNTNYNSYAVPSVRLASASSMSMKGSSPSITSAGEEKGSYFYSLKSKYILRASSSIRLPFVTVNPQCRFYYQATTSIGTGQYNGVFQRVYDLTPDKFLPAGLLTIRDRQVLMGQSNLPDVPNNYSQSITLGQDADVRYSVHANLTASSKENTVLSWQTYQANITVSNYKTKDVTGRLNFNGGLQTIIEETTCKGITVDGNTGHLPFEVKGNANYQCQLLVTFKWG